MKTIIIITCNRFRMVVFNMLLIITIGTLGTVHAQGKHQKKRLYKAWVKKTNGKTRLVGALYQVEDNKLVIANRFKLNHYNLNQFDYQDVYAHEIEKIKLRRKGKLGRGILIGVASGLVTGAIIGFVAGDDPPCKPPPNIPISSISGYGSLYGHIAAHIPYVLCQSMSYTAEQKALGAGIALGMVGGIVGAVIGSLQIKISINGSTEKFKANKIGLQWYSYKGHIGASR